MVIWRSVIMAGLGVAAMCGAPQPLAAQVSGQMPMVSAKEPPQILKALISAGYKAKAVQDQDHVDRLYLEVETDDVFVNVIFTDCHSVFAKTCETLVLSSAWDRETPMSAERVAKANSEFSYVSILIDEDGDPFIQWAIHTSKEGIPTAVFLKAFERFVEVADDFSHFAFEDDKVSGRGKGKAKD